MKKYIIYIILITSVLACEETIDWVIEESVKKLVVDASLTNELKKHYVILSKTRGYDDFENIEMIQNANIELSDGTNTYSYVEDLNSPGCYYTENEIKGKIGETYTLNIKLDQEISGHDTYSASSEMKPVFEIDSLIASYELEVFSLFGFNDTSIYCGVKITALELATEGDRYMFEIYNNGYLLSDSLGESPILTDENLNNFQFTEELFFYEDTTEIRLNDTVTVEVHSINDAYLDFVMYYRQAQSGGDPLGLSGPPSNLPTNINNGGIGFFVVSAVSKKTAIVFDNLPENWQLIK